MTEGYVAIAFDDRRYVEIAANLALSVRRADTRPISLLVNAAAPVPPALAALFDRIILVPDDPTLKGAMNKARLYDFTPYERTLYVDTDCLLFSPRVELFWHKYRGRAFAVEGHRQSTGPAFACSLGRKDAAALCGLLSIPFLSVFNAGVMYFERTDGSRAVFDKVMELYRGPHRDAISYPYKHAGEYADEPFFGAALAALGIAPLEPPLADRLQVTTPNMIDAVMDLDLGDLRVVKQPAGGAPQLWAGVLCHFCGLAPMQTYFDLADRLRREAGLAAMERSHFRPVLLSATHHAETATHP